MQRTPISHPHTADTYPILCTEEKNFLRPQTLELAQFPTAIGNHCWKRFVIWLFLLSLSLPFSLHFSRTKFMYSSVADNNVHWKIAIYSDSGSQRDMHFDDGKYKSMRLCHYYYVCATFQASNANMTGMPTICGRIYMRFGSMARPLFPPQPIDSNSQIWIGR